MLSPMTTWRGCIGASLLVALLLAACGSDGGRATASSSASASRSASSGGPTSRVTVTLEFVDGADDRVGDAAVAVLRRRIDRLELANPEIKKSRDQLTVRFDGPKPDQETIDALTTTASLEFRPVCALLPADVTFSVLAQALDPAVSGPCVQTSAEGS